MNRHIYKVIVSSTLLDKLERCKLLHDTITLAGMVWRGIEIFTAWTHPGVEP